MVARIVFGCVAAVATVCMAGYRSGEIALESSFGHGGDIAWRMARLSDVKGGGAEISSPDYVATGWMEAIVPGTVLNTLVANGVYPEPYFGLNNKLGHGIPDLNAAGRDFYTAWFRAEFKVPQSFDKKQIWLRSDGINYRSEIWINSQLAAVTAGMFSRPTVNITRLVKPGSNIIAVKVFPVDSPGSTMPKSWGAANEFHNGGNGEIGRNVTMLMCAGWDFTFMDGVRDRNAGIWREPVIFATPGVRLDSPFVRSKVNWPQGNEAEVTLSVELHNPGNGGASGELSAKISGVAETLKRQVKLYRGETRTETFTVKIRNPRIWWPIFKGEQPLYRATFTFADRSNRDEIATDFGIRNVTSDQNTPDKSRLFYVNNRPFFVRGSNWIPDAMLRTDDAKLEAEIRYTAQSGINMLRLWGGGIVEREKFYELCDKYGILVWQEFWMTGDTRHPDDPSVYLANVSDAVKQIRNHPSLAYYVASNESTMISGTKELIESLDGTRGFQMQSECDGIHDGSPYKTVNPMRHYENTASDRGSRVDGFNPEYGTPCLPTLECLREMMDEKDLWPINREVWDYHDGDGFNMITTDYKTMTEAYGKCGDIGQYARQAQAVGATCYRAIWEVWNANKLKYGKRWCSGVLFWYHNPCIRTTGGRMWDWSLEPTAALYYTQKALEPLHAQFDYLDNTVSVINDTRSDANLKVSAELYDFNSKLVKSWTGKPIKVPAEGVADNALKLEFPPNLTQVHFIKLVLSDVSGKAVSDNFYWRSNSKYEGRKTLTGPCASGFEDLGTKLAKTKLDIVKKVANGRISLSFRNSGDAVAFMTQIKIFGNDGKLLRPTFMSDNFFSLLPGETKTVYVEPRLMPSRPTLTVQAWNTPEYRF